MNTKTGDDLIATPFTPVFQDRLREAVYELSCSIPDI